MTSTRWNCLCRPWLTGLLIVGTLASEPVDGAETVITQDVRIQKPAKPKLILDQTGANARTWEVEGNGPNFFIRDATAGTIPFRMFGGAPPGSMQLWDNGLILGGNWVHQEAHLQISGVFADALLRLEAMSGTGQAWQFRGGFDEFQLSDVTADTTPFSMDLETPTNMLYLAAPASGHVGIGTSLPESIGSATAGGGRHLNLNASAGEARAIVQGQAAAEWYIVHKGGAANQKIVRARVQNGKYFLSTVLDNLAGTVEPHAFTIKLSNGYVGIKTGDPTHPLQVGDPGANDGNGAHVTKGGVWTNASSRSVKQDIHPLTEAQAIAAVNQLQPVRYRYRNDPEENHVGFIAEEVPDLVATRDRKSLAEMDVLAVLTRVLQDQDRALDEARREQTRLQTALEQLQCDDEACERQLAGQQVELERQRPRLEQQQVRLKNLQRRVASLEETDRRSEQHPLID